MDKFKILHKDGKARVGELSTPQGVIETPCFIPVGTQATVKALSPKDLKEIGVQVVLTNTYHLMLRPGAKLIHLEGGLHKFMNWDKPIMTDSGGYQVFSLGVALEHGSSKWFEEKSIERARESRERSRLNLVTEEGVWFRSHLDGSENFLSPKLSIKIQHHLGADLIVAFDDHESSKHSYEQIKKSLELSERWQLRSLEEHKKRRGAKLSHLRGGQILYGVTHGSLNQDLRIRSAKFVDKNFEAIAIGGVYGTKKHLYQIIEWTIDNVSDQKPRHLLGIGEVEDLFECIERGVDLFDCVAPTRRARNGSLYVSPQSGVYSDSLVYHGRNFSINIGQGKFTNDKKPIDPSCHCYTCQNFSRAYLRHLFVAKELLYHQLATYHNVYFITHLVEEIREAIKEGRFESLKNTWLKTVSS